MKPWKRQALPRGPRQPRGFNGATAMKPWKSSRIWRPCSPRQRLQWGHGDEAVEEGGGATTIAQQTQYQWGHGDEAVEEGPPPGPFEAKDLGPGLREGRPAGVSNRSRARAMKS